MSLDDPLCHASLHPCSPSPINFRPALKTQMSRSPGSSVTNTSLWSKFIVLRESATNSCRHLNLPHVYFPLSALLAFGTRRVAVEDTHTLARVSHSVRPIPHCVDTSRPFLMVGLTGHVPQLVMGELKTSSQIMDSD